MTAVTDLIKPLIIVSGPSGVGKGTLISRLIQGHPNSFVTTISHTTREPRPGELTSASDTYQFVSIDEFKVLVEQDAFVEHAQFSGNLYGTSWQTVLDQQKTGKAVILDINMDGIKNLKRRQQPIRCVFIAPPSLQVLEDRLRGRATETDESIQKRLAEAEVEIKFSDTRGIDDILIINDNLDDAYARLEEWALRR